MSKSLIVTARAHLLRTAGWRRIVSVVVLIFAVGFLAYKAYTSWETLKVYDWQLQYIYFLPSFLTFLVQLVIVSWGWQSIMNHLAQPLSFREHLRIYSYTNLMRRIPAGMLWLVTGRVYAYKGRNISARLTAVGSFLEYLLVILTGLPIAALACSAFGFISPATGVTLACVTLVLALVAIHPAIMGKLLAWARRETLPAELRYWVTLTWAFIYALVWIVSGIGLWLIVCMFGAYGLDQIPLAIGAMTLSSLIAYATLLSPSGLGIKEVSLTILLGTYLPEPLPLLVALAVRAVWTVYDVFVGALAWLTRSDKELHRQHASEDQPKDEITHK